MTQIERSAHRHQRKRRAAPGPPTASPHNRDQRGHRQHGQAAEIEAAAILMGFPNPWKAAEDRASQTGQLNDQETPKRHWVNELHHRRHSEVSRLEARPAQAMNLGWRQVIAAGSDATASGMLTASSK